MKCYIMASAALLPRQQEVIHYVDNMPAIVNWRVSQGALFLASYMSIHEVTTLIRAKFPDIQFILVEANILNTQGWADKETWSFINDPKAPGQPRLLAPPQT